MEETDCLTQGWAQEGRESKMGSAKPLMEAVFGTDGYVAQGLSAARAEATRAARGRTNIARDDTFFFFFWGKERRKSGSFRGSCWVYILLGAKKKKEEAGAYLQDGLSFSSVVYFGRRWVCLDLTVLCLQLWAFPKQTDEG